MNEKKQDITEKEVSVNDIIVKLGEWKNHLLSKWTVFLIVYLWGTVLGFVYAYLKKPTYKAELSFALEDEKSTSGLGAAAGLANQLGFDFGGVGGGAFSGDNLLVLMKCRTIVEKTLLTPIYIKTIMSFNS